MDLLQQFCSEIGVMGAKRRLIQMFYSTSIHTHVFTAGEWRLENQNPRAVAWRVRHKDPYQMQQARPAA
jgi:hypothetical protein